MGIKGSNMDNIHKEGDNFDIKIRYKDTEANEYLN